MIRTIGSHLKTGFTRDILRVTLLSGLLLILAPKIQSQTKPSDVFFGSPSELQIAEEKVGLRSIGQEVGKNYLSPHSIIAKEVVLRGWLTCNLNDDGQCLGAVVPNKENIGIGDMHYELMLDYDFMVSTYGANAGVLNRAMLPGHGPDTWDTQATPIPIKNPLANTLSGIDINSFWLPYTNFPDFHVELNAWHPNSSHRNCQWVLGNPVACSTHNFEGRGPAPSGWVEKDYGPVETNSSENWWPFDPDDPDGLLETGASTLQQGPNYPQYQRCVQECDCAPDARGKPNAACMNECIASCRKIPNAFVSVPTTVPKNLQVGDYVEMKGTLWQDLYHHDPKGPDSYYTYCWNVNPFQNQGGWLELHPVDSIRRVSSPGYSPYDKTLVSDPIASAKQGVKRIVGAALCSDAQGASVDASISRRIAVCPDRTYDLGSDADSLHARAPEQLVPHHLNFVDGRFTDTAGVGAATTHKVDVVADCVYIQDYWPPGLKSAHYKATYVVWWTPPGVTGTHFANPDTGPKLGVGRISNPLTTQPPPLAASVCPTVDGKSCTSIGPQGRPLTAPLMDIVTVTSSGAPMAGVTVSVSGQPTVTTVTNKNGVAVITRLPCYAYVPGAPVPRPGQPQPGRRLVACQATASMNGYQPYSFSLP